MSLITVKPKFQVTIPVKLRESIGLQEGDLMEATVVDDGIFLRPNPGLTPQPQNRVDCNRNPLINIKRGSESEM